MTSNYPRIALWIVLGFALWLNYEAWLKDYTAIDAANVAAARVTSGSPAAEIPQFGNASSPAGSAVAARAPNGVAAPITGSSLTDAAGGAAGPSVHVHTDVLDLQISLTGGTITQADLNEYTRVKGQGAGGAA